MANANLSLLKQTIIGSTFLFGMTILSSCGEVKVVEQNSPLAAVNPLGELVRVTVDRSADMPIHCLRLAEPNFGNELVTPIAFECDGGQAYFETPEYSLFRLNSECN